MTVVCCSSITLTSERGTPCHLMRAMAKYVPVIYINPPHSYKRWLKEREELRREIDRLNIRVITPVLPTTFRFLPRKVRRKLVAFLSMPQVYQQVTQTLTQPVVLWSYLSELTFAIHRCLKPTILCYHVLDDFSVLSPKDRYLEAAIENLADLLFVVSPALQERYAKQGRQVFLLPNGVDVQHFTQALSPDISVPQDLAKLSSPRIGFVGMVNPAWVDTSLLLQIAQSRPEWSVVIIGPLSDWSPPRNLPPNCHFLGVRPYQTVPFYLKGLDVCLIPFKDNAITRAASPLKLYEYLAAGRAVVSCFLPDLENLPPGVVWQADNLNDFLLSIEEAITKANDPKEQQRRLNAVSPHSWENRAQEVLKILNNTLPQKLGQ